MPATTIYYDFWLPTGDHYESDSIGDTNYEGLLARWAQDEGSTQYHNLLTQYYGDNGGTTAYITNNVTFGGVWVDTSPYPHAGTTTDPLTDTDIQNEVHNAVTSNGWRQDITHVVAVFTADNIQECYSPQSCTFNAFCAYHSNFTDGSNDAIYAYMSFDNFTHVAGSTCVAGQEVGDTDPYRNVYPNGDMSADGEISTLSHELAETETDPHPLSTWNGIYGEIGDMCNFNFTPRNSNGADVYLNGHPYIVQQEWSNAISTCGIDLASNGFCTGSVSQACPPTTTFTNAVDNSSPYLGSTINYTLTLTNINDTGTETNLTVSDSFPNGYSIANVSATGASAPPSWTSSLATIQFDTLPVHQTDSITISAVPAQAGTTASDCGDQSGSDLIGTSLATQVTSPCASTDPQKVPTALTYTGSVSGDYNDPATLSGVLTDYQNHPVSGKTIAFTLNSAEHCAGTTDSTGTASCTITPGESAGPNTLVAAFADSSDPVYATTSSSSSFAVNTEETAITYGGPTVILAASSATLSTTLRQDGTSPIAGRTVTLGIGGQGCSGTTNASGTAQCTLTFTGALGPQRAFANFAGDAVYRPSADNTKTAILFSFAIQGAFALGDRTVAGATPSTVLTWWASNWNKLNSLSGGTAPSNFKGFAATTTLPSSTPPPSCGSNWTTGLTFSPPPASGIPSYMGVIVTSKVTKSAGGVAGNCVHIVVVKVNPGYQPNPNNSGTGSIVGTYC